MPSTAKTEIANIALSRIGVSRVLVDVDSDTGAEPRAILVHYANARDAVLREWAWPFASLYVTLALQDEDADDPLNLDWRFAYSFPENVLAIRRFVTDGGRRESEPPAFRIGTVLDDDDDPVKVIFADVDTDYAIVEVTRAVTDEGEFDANFIEAFAWRLASAIAPALSRMDGITEKAEQRYREAISEAKAVSLTESQDHVENDASFTRARD